MLPVAFAEFLGAACGLFITISRVQPVVLVGLAPDAICFRCLQASDSHSCASRDGRRSSRHRSAGAAWSIFPPLFIRGSRGITVPSSLASEPVGLRWGDVHAATFVIIARSSASSASTSSRNLPSPITSFASACWSRCTRRMTICNSPGNSG